jgi:hypothetical protein
MFTSEKTRVFVVSEPRRSKYNPQIPLGKGLTWGTFWINVQHVDQFANPRNSPVVKIKKDSTLGLLRQRPRCAPDQAWQNLTLRYLIKPRKLLLLTAITYQTGDLVVIAFHTRNSARVLESSAFRELARDYPSTSS